MAHPRGFFGNSQTDARKLTGLTQVVISLADAPAEVYSISVGASAADAFSYSLSDASATAGGSVSPLFVINAVGAGIFSPNLATPIRFEKGIYLSYTATGSGNLDSNIQWDGVPVHRGPGTGAT